MKKSLLILLFFVLSLFKIYAQTYSITRGGTMAEIATPGTGVTTITTLGDDNFTGALNIGFNFNFYSTTYTQFYIGSNGVISFGSGQSGSYGVAQPTNPNGITFAGADLNCFTSTPTINYFVSGTAPNRRLVVNFKNVQHFFNSANLSNIQIQLYEGSNNIELHITNVQSAPGGFNRCIGVCNSTNTAFTTQASINGVNTVSVINEMIRFSPPLPSPDINLKGNGVSIVNGDVTPSTADHTKFGSVDISTGSIVRTFTIENTGTSNLTLTGSPIVNITGPNASDFTVTTFPSTPIAGGSSTTFQVTFDPATAGGKQATISIANNDPDENPYTFDIFGLGTLPAPASPFITRWNLATAGSGANQISFDVGTSGTVNYTWQQVGGSASGSGSFSGTTATITGLPTGTTVDLSIAPTNFQFFKVGNTDQFRLTEVKQWGSVAWTDMAYTFWDCRNLNITATDLPNLSGVSSMYFMFRTCRNLNGPSNINSWNTADVTNMGYMFFEATVFNQNIGSWNTAAVTDMPGMFGATTAFNQNIGSWNTAAVTNMNGMFIRAIAFNQNIGTWNTAAVKDMGFMFNDAAAFNQNIGLWNTAAVTNMMAMFDHATAFNQNIGSWNTAAVTNMSYMFQGASAFNQNIGSWNTAIVNNMRNTFTGATAFNQNIGAWNTAAVTVMRLMFSYASAFNQNIGSWNTAAVTDMVAMFDGASAFNQNIGSWNITNAINMGDIFYNSGINTSNYDAILTSWNTAGYINKNLGNASPLKYCATAIRTTLTTAIASGGKGWTITGDALNSNCSGTAPEINLKGNNLSIVSGDITPSTTDHTDFGLANVALSTVVRTFTVENLGTAILSLSGIPSVSITGINASNFTVSAVPATSVAVSGSTTFQITFAPTANGVKTATVSIANNDSDENPYTFAIRGEAGPVVSIVNGNWENANTWNFNRVPLITDNVIINTGHTVNVTTNSANARKVEYKANAIINFVNSLAKLNIGSL
jgi:surface protein